MEKIITNQVICSSDRNVKENIADLPISDPSLIRKIEQVGIKSFNYKDDELKNKIYGVLAQDVKEAGLDELVYEKEDKTLAVDYISLLILEVLYLKNELGVAQGRVTYTNRRFNELYGKIIELENKINKNNNENNEE